MRHWISKNKFHIMIWAFLILYLVSARDLYNEFILKNGKPVAQLDGISVPEFDGKYYIDGLDQVRYDGQDLFLLRGWAFNPDDHGTPLQEYTKQIILASRDRWYVFNTGNIPRPDLSKAMKEQDSNFTDDVTYAGFQGHISDSILSTGSYQIGIQFTAGSETPKYLIWTNRYLHRTPNKLILVDQPIETTALETFINKVKRRLSIQVPNASGN